MTKALLLAVCVMVTLGAQDGGTCPDCTDPTRPWLRGSIEKSCAAPGAIAAFQREHPEAIYLACECQHRCDPEDERAGETDGRAWDPACQARCNPANCQCVHACS